jgi:alcohol dehydrogenase
MQPFDFQLRTQIVFGPDRLDELGQLAGQLGARRALVVSDPGIIKAGHTERGIDALRRARIETHLFDGVHENPSTDDVEAGREVARRYEPELIVGLGGGSSMDCAKGINFLFTNGGRMQDYLGIGKALRPLVPMIAVPTTAGTGSETQSFALITDAATRVKMACGDKKASFRIAILDPKLTLTQPARVTAVTGIDAVAHAVETFVTKRRSAASLVFSREAWRQLAGNFSRVVEAPDDLAARSGMQLGACLAGLAIENSMLGAAHALANPLTANYGIVHGQAVGLMLPHVVRFNGPAVADWYADLLEVTAGSDGVPPPKSGPEGLADFLSELVARASLAGRLSECGVEHEKLPALADAAAGQWTLQYNPRPPARDQLLEIYEKAF